MTEQNGHNGAGNTANTGAAVDAATTAERIAKLAGDLPAKATEELTRPGLKQYGGRIQEEFLPQLIGYRGAKVYREMSDNDPVVGAVLFAIEMLIRQVEWWVEPGGDSPEDKRAAEFLESCMHDMSETWEDTISEILSMLIYGYSPHEVVYKRREGHNPDDGKRNSKFDDGYIGWRKMPAISQDTIERWSFDQSDESLLGLVQRQGINEVPVPIAKMLLFRTRVRKRNPEGRSVLRNAYRPWYFKKRIEEVEAIGVERDLAGFPQLQGPEGLNLFDDQNPQMIRLRRNAEALVRGVRRDELEGLLIPYGWTFSLTSTGGQRQMDTSKIIERLDRRIAAVTLADVILIGHEAVGSYALADSKTSFLSLGISAWIQMIRSVFNSFAVPPLFRMNPFRVENLPVIECGDIETPNLEVLGAYIAQLAGIGAIDIDEVVKEYLRQAASLPPKPEGENEPPPDEPDPNRGEGDTDPDSEGEGIESLAPAGSGS